MAASAGTVRTADGVLPWTKANNICQYAKVQIFVFLFANHIWKYKKGVLSLQKKGDPEVFNVFK